MSLSSHPLQGLGRTELGGQCRYFGLQDCDRRSQNFCMSGDILHGGQSMAAMTKISPKIVERGVDVTFLEVASGRQGVGKGLALHLCNKSRLIAN